MHWWINKKNTNFKQHIARAVYCLPILFVAWCLLITADRIFYHNQVPLPCCTHHDFTFNTHDAASIVNSLILGLRFNTKTGFTRYGDLHDRLIFIMGIPILVRQHLYIETAPWRLINDWTWYIHDDAIKWKHFVRYWPFVRGIHWSPVDSPHKRPVTQSFDIFFHVRLNKRFSKQSKCWWFETQWRSLWRHCNGVISKSLIPHPTFGICRSKSILCVTILVLYHQPSHCHSFRNLVPVDIIYRCPISKRVSWLD